MSATEDRQNREINVLVGYFADPAETRRLIDDEGAAEEEAHRRKWTEANLRSIHFTTGFFLVLFSIQLCFFIFLAVTSVDFQNLSWLLLAYFSIFAGRGILSLIFWRTRENKNHDANTFTADCQKAFRKRFSFKLSVWRGGCYINLWSLRSIWLWTLQVGITTAFIKTWQEAVAVNPVAPEYDLVYLARQLLGSLVLALVAYIATNVVREMLQMRVRYQDGLRTIKEVQESLQKSRESIQGVLDEHKTRVNEVTGALTDQAKRIFALSNVAGIKKSYEDLLAVSKADVSTDLIKTAFENISNEAAALSKRMMSMSTGRLRSMYLDVLNPYIEAELRAFESTTTGMPGIGTGGIVTRFSVAGQMVRGLLEGNYPDVTFHALLVIPPARFLNYGHLKEYDQRGKELAQANHWQKLVGGDPDWEAYLEANLMAAEHNIPVQRQFLAIVEDCPIDQTVLPSEAVALRSDFVHAQLQLFVLCREGKPVRFAGENEITSTPKDGIKWKYRIEENPDDPPADSGLAWSPLAEVIGTKYHIGGNCRVRQIEAKEFVNTLDGLGRLFRDKTTGKPWDYFAIRDTTEGKWLFCLQMRYDKDFDVAILDIVYPDGQNSQVWNETVAVLDNLFIDEDHISEITRYAAETLKG